MEIEEYMILPLSLLLGDIDTDERIDLLNENATQKKMIALMDKLMDIECV